MFHQLHLMLQENKVKVVSRYAVGSVTIYKACLHVDTGFLLVCCVLGHLQKQVTMKTR